MIDDSIGTLRPASEVPRTPEDADSFHIPHFAGIGMGNDTYNARSVHSLEHAREIDQARDLLNQYGSQALGTELLVHAEKVDLNRLYQLAVHLS